MHTGNRDIPCSSVFIRSFVRDVQVRQEPANADREPPAQVLRRHAAAAAHARRGAGVAAAARRGRRQGGRDGGALKVFMRPEPSELPGQRGPPHGRLRLRQLCVIPARGNGPVHAGYANSSIAFDDRPNGSYWPIAAITRGIRPIPKSAQFCPGWGASSGEYDCQGRLRMKNFFAGPVVLALFALTTIPALAQYPARPIHLIVPFPAGGVVDTVGRILGQALTQ